MTNAFDDKRIGFIGCGAMARALAGGLLTAGVEASRLAAADPASEPEQSMQKTSARSASRTNSSAAAAGVQSKSRSTPRNDGGSP